MLQAQVEHGGCLLGAFQDAEMVGFVFGFSGPPQQNYLLSHLAAVHPRLQGQGLGLRLKQAQADWAREQGFERIVWTFDPLQPANARLNLSKLGAVGRRYLVDYYGPLDDELSRGIPTDRLELEWWIRPIQRHRQQMLCFPHPLPPEQRMHWRLHLREQFQQAFAAGLWVVGFEAIEGEACYWLGQVSHAAD